MILASLRLSVVSIFVTLLAFASQILIAHTFGARHPYDVYLFAISIPFLVMGASMGALPQAFVPRLMAARGERELYRRSITGLLRFALVGAVVIAFAGFQLTAWSTASVRGIFSAGDLAEIARIARVAWFGAALALVASALTAVHHTEKSFVLPAMTAASSYLGMIAAMLMLSGARGPVILAWGMLGGSLISILALLPKVFPLISAHGMTRSELRNLFDGAGRVVLVVVANCAFTGLAPVEAFLAPRFGVGALSYLGYSQRLIIAMGTIVVAGPSVLLVPAIAEACVEKNDLKVKRLSAKAIGAVCVAGTLAAVLFGLLRAPLIRIVLQHGAFDAATARGVTSTLPWLLVGSVAMLGTQIAFRSLYGQNMHLLPAVAGILVPGLYFGLGNVLSGAIGFQGICIAYATSWWLIFVAVLIGLYGPSVRYMRPSASARSRDRVERTVEWDEPRVIKSETR